MTTENELINSVSGKLNTDASNLTSAGQKVFDGQWIKSSNALVTSGTLPTNAASRIEVDLSTILPNDGYCYEVTFNGALFVGNTDARCTLSIYDKDTEISHYMCRASKAGESGAGNAIVCIGNLRTVVVDYWGTNAGIFDLKMQGYRRIGTNA